MEGFVIARNFANSPPANQDRPYAPSPHLKPPAASAALVPNARPCPLAGGRRRDRRKSGRRPISVDPNHRLPRWSTGYAIASITVAPDSPLEGTGIELSVPLFGCRVPSSARAGGLHAWPPSASARHGISSPRDKASRDQRGSTRLPPDGKLRALLKIGMHGRGQSPRKPPAHALHHCGQPHSGRNLAVCVLISRSPISRTSTSAERVALNGVK